MILDLQSTFVYDFLLALCHLVSTMRNTFVISNPRSRCANLQVFQRDSLDNVSASPRIRAIPQFAFVLEFPSGED